MKGRLRGKNRHPPDGGARHIRSPRPAHPVSGEKRRAARALGGLGLAAGGTGGGGRGGIGGRGGAVAGADGVGGWVVDLGRDFFITKEQRNKGNQIAYSLFLPCFVSLYKILYIKCISGSSARFCSLGRGEFVIILAL